MVDRQGTIVLVNRETERLFGYTRDELVGQPIERLVPERFRDGHPDVRQEFLKHPQTRAMGAGRDLFGIHKDGSEIPVEIGLNPIEAEEGFFVLASVIDIGPRKQAEAELRRSNEELERFAYVASHDLREPLRTITGFLGLLSRRHRDRLDDEGREFVDLAVDGAKRMDSLIADLLEYSRVGRCETEPAPVDVGAAWSVAVRNLGAAIAESSAEITAGPLPTVMADRGEMVQVLQNLLGNAIKYRGHDAPRIHIDAVRCGEEWEIAVTDDGPGIDPRHHDRIFVLLHRLHSRDEVDGTGIGLAICKKVIERAGGRIWVESAEGEGARFVVTLPAAEPALVAPELVAV